MSLKTKNQPLDLRSGASVTEKAGAGHTTVLRIHARHAFTRAGFTGLKPKSPQPSTRKTKPKQTKPKIQARALRRKLVPVTEPSWEYMHDMLSLEPALAAAMKQLPSIKFEKVLHPIFQEVTSRTLNLEPYTLNPEA